LAVDFLAVDFLAADFLAADFLAAGMVIALLSECHNALPSFFLKLSGEGKPPRAGTGASMFVRKV
jgi:hypothetical protein